MQTFEQSFCDSEKFGKLKMFLGLFRNLSNVFSEKIEINQIYPNSLHSGFPLQALLSAVGSSSISYTVICSVTAVSYSSISSVDRHRLFVFVSASTTLASPAFISESTDDQNRYCTLNLSLLLDY